MRDFQDKIFSAVISKFSKQADAVNAIAQALSTNNDAIYRRLRGETLLTAEEIARLADRFSLSLDAMLHEKSSKVLCSYSAFYNPIKDIQSFLENLLKELQYIYSLPEGKLYYATQETPVFQYMYFPELILFKLYAWGVTTWNLEYLKNIQFNFDIFPAITVRSTEEIAKLYNAIPTIELYNLNIFNSTTSQIEYLASIEKFSNPKDAILIYDKLIELIQHMSQMAKHGYKFTPSQTPEVHGAAYEVYHNELVNTNNLFLIHSEQVKFLATTHCTPYFLRSNDDKLVDYTEKWLTHIIKQSSSISVHNRRNRIWFFNVLEEKVLNSRKRLEALLQN